MHDVRFSIPERELGKADIEFLVKKDGKVFGTMKVSKGSIVWFPKDTTYGHKTGWSKFDEFMKGQERYEKRK
ncbi:MAG: hypothetical protein ACK5YS_04155 [bacterium]|jgi:hypothetical protein